MNQVRSTIGQGVHRTDHTRSREEGSEQAKLEGGEMSAMFQTFSMPLFPA